MSVCCLWFSWQNMNVGYNQFQIKNLLSFGKVLAISGDRGQLFHGLLKLSKMPFYAVAKGRTTGIYNTWPECEVQVKGFSGARYKKFDSLSSANEFIQANGFSANGAHSNSTNYYNNNKSNNLKRTYATSSNNITKYTFESSDDDLDEIISKQMDDVERRVKTFSTNLDKKIKSSSATSQKKTIMIEPPQPKRYKSNKNGFEVDEDGYVQVYTDGACSSNGKHCAQAGLGVYWGDNHSLNKSEPVTGRATNNCGEIQAATLAMKLAIKKGVKKLAINTDSQFLINSATKWMPGWKRRGWKLSSGESVKNEADFKDLDSVQNKLQVKWNYVKAHNGLHGNEMADRLAKAGAALYNK